MLMDREHEKHVKESVEGVSALTSSFEDIGLSFKSPFSLIQHSQAISTVQEQNDT